MPNTTPIETMDSINDPAKVTATHAPPARPKRPSKGRVFQCTGYPDCSMSFTRSEHLARHLRKHTGERPFTCPHCSKSFSRLDNLRQHKQTVHAYEIQPLAHSHDEYHEARQPETPYHPSPGSYGNTPLQPVLISPADSTSPNPLYQDNRSHYMLYEHGLKIPAHLFKPKRRPRPLSLLHSFVEQGNSSSPDTIGSFQRPQLHSAPPVSFNKHRTVFTYPSSSSLIPSMVSPLSPLFHQSFNQVGGHTGSLPPISSQNNVSHITSPYASSTFRFTQSRLLLSSSLPSVKQLRLDSRSNSDTLIPSVNASSIDAAQKEIPTPPKTESRKSWLQGVLNDENNQTIAQQGPNGETIPTDPVTKRATITSLLSP